MKKPYVMGIAGCTQSGKSTFTNELQNILQGVRYKTFAIDNYHRPMEERPLVKAPMTGIEYPDSNLPISFDIPKLRMELKNEIMKNEVELIIVEGTMILYDEEILRNLDLKIYVETRADERSVRYIEKYSQWYGYDFIRNSYLDLARYRMDEYVEHTKWRADLLLNGSMKSEHAVEMIKLYLLNKIASLRT